MYETELMREILQSDMSRKMAQKISPRYGDAYVFLWLLEVMGAEVGEIEKWCEELQLQVVPQTATWALKYYEKEFGIIPDPSWSYERRRQTIINRMRSRGPMNPARLEAIISAVTGTDVRVEENTGKNRFAVYITASPDMIDEKAVRSAIKKAKPVRLVYDLLYEQVTSVAMYTGGAIRKSKEIVLKQL